MELCKLVNTADTKVYAMPITELKNKSFFNQLYGLVHEERKNKIDRMKFCKGKCLSLGVEYLLLRACWDFGLNYQTESQVVDEFGKPGFEHCPIHFNLSHSGDQVMCIMSRFSVGCDVEKKRKLDRDIGNRFFSIKEQKLLQQCQSEEERENLFFRIWTLKESFMKCTGLGFHLALEDFSIVFAQDGIEVEQSVDMENYHLYERFDGSYQYAWCVKE